MSASRRRAMTVGELSRRSGVPIKALREHTDLGLIYTLGRSPGNYRLLGTEALGRVRFIGQLRALGLTIAEIRELTPLDGGGCPTSLRLAELLRRSRARAERRIAEQRQILCRIAQFEADRRADLGDGDLCAAGNPRGCGAWA